jgi:8-hydroxy-5-deazaflavin:NADPH oxidoreductase
MRIGILGSGAVGQTIGSKLVQIGHEVYMGSRDAANPKAIAWANNENINKQSSFKHALFGTFANAAEFGEVLFNCTLGPASLIALGQAGIGNLRGKILLDTANPVDYSDTIWTLTTSNTDSLGEQIQRAFPETKVVKTLNTMNCDVMINPNKLAETTDVFISGNSAEAKAKTASYLREWFGWRSVIDLGDITTSRAAEMFIPMWRCLRLATKSHHFNIKVVGT